MPFAGLKVLSLESRRAREMETLIRRAGGDPFLAPSVQERALANGGDALRFVGQLEAGEFDLVICMTGVGLELLRQQVAPERLGAALRKTAVLSRGPKPLPALHGLGVRPAIVIEEPNTWKEIVAAVAARPERRIAIQEYGRPNPALNAALEQLGARVSSVTVYRWELPEDLEPLRTAARLLAERAVDVVLFTSSIQLDHLLLVAGQLGLQSGVCRALRDYTAVASVGPVMTASLESAGFTADIVPVRPKMAALVKAASEAAAAVIAPKRLTRPRE